MSASRSGRALLWRFGCLGNWWPVNFPSYSMRKPKMHVISYVLGPMALRHRSLGLQTEQVIEVVHAMMNRYQHLYRHITNPVQRMKAEVQCMQRKSATMNPNFVNMAELTVHPRTAAQVEVQRRVLSMSSGPSKEPKKRKAAAEAAIEC